MSPRTLEVRPTYRKRRLWPWIAAAVALLVVGLWELGAHRRERPEVPKASIHGVSGHVITSEGRAAPGVEVIGLPDGTTARSDEAGRFELPVADGTVIRVEAHHSDLGFASAEARAPASRIDLRLAPRAGLRVHVVSSGRPVQGALISVRPLLHPEGVLQADRGTDADGVLRFLGLPAGRLLVEAQLEGSGAQAVTSVEAVDGAVTETTVSLPDVASGPGRDGARPASGR